MPIQGTYNGQFVALSTWERRMTFSLNGTAIDFTSPAPWEAEIQLRKNGQIFITLSTDDGTITLDANGHLDIEASEEDVANVPADLYEFDVKITNPTTGKVYRWVKGSIKVNQAVTQTEGLHE